jgi:DNA-binding response OmpR family regulator
MHPPRGRASILHKLLRIFPDLGLARLATYGICVSSPQVSVLVVEDDPGIATQLVRGLERAGYTADSVSLGAEALRRPPFDVVLLDLGLPDLDGIDVCRRLRADSDTAIIVVTARGEEADRVLALDEGADDYLVKPFGLAELLARIRAVLRRGQRPGAAGGEVLRHGPLTVDLRTRRVTMSGADVALTPKEFAILECLITDPGRLISRQEIVERAWDEHWYGPTKVLDVHLAALRRKLGDPALIETVYGHGFRLADREAVSAGDMLAGGPLAGSPAGGTQG